MTGDRQWRIRLASAAEDDFRNILRWMAERFGETHACAYADILSRAIQALAAGPRVSGARERHEIADGLMALHVARRGRHLVLYRVGSPVIDALRLLHDSMDMPRQFSSRERDES